MCATFARSLTTHLFLVRRQRRVPGKLRHARSMHGLAGRVAEGGHGRRVATERLPPLPPRRWLRAALSPADTRPVGIRDEPASVSSVAADGAEAAGTKRLANPTGQREPRRRAPSRRSFRPPLCSVRSPSYPLEGLRA